MGSGLYVVANWDRAHLSCSRDMKNDAEHMETAKADTGPPSTLGAAETCCYYRDDTMFED